MEIKSGKRTYKLTTKDRIMFNGAAYVLVTQKVKDGWYEYSPTLTISKMQKLIKKGELVLCKEKYQAAFGEEYDLYKIRREPSDK